MMFLVLCLFVVVFAEDPKDSHPLYKYRYQTQDLMKTSASEIPYRGYHIVEGGYYPEKFYQPTYDRFPRYRSFDEFGGYQPFFYPHGFVDKNVYATEKKDSHGENYEKAHGEKEVEGGHGRSGFNKEGVAVKDVKGDTGSYKDEEGFKKGFDDAKSYQGGGHFNREGENGKNEKQNNSHKKGHSTKGFHTSHHKDETGKTETFYDEANDEGNNYNYDGHQGSFGEKGQSAYKGGHENGQFEQDEKQKQGHYDRQRIVDNANAEKGGYDQKGYHGSGEVYRINNGVGQQSLLGRQEANREYTRHHPYGYIPFNPGY